SRSVHGDLLFKNEAVGRSNAAVFVGLRVDNPYRAGIDFRWLNTLIGEELKDRFLVRFALGVNGGQFVAGFFVADGPDGEVGLDLALDEAFDGDIAIAELGGFYLSAQEPAARGDPEGNNNTAQKRAARRNFDIVHGDSLKGCDLTRRSVSYRLALLYRISG